MFLSSVVVSCDVNVALYRNCARTSTHTHINVLIIREVKKCNNNFTTGRKKLFAQAVYKATQQLWAKKEINFFYKPLEFMEAYKYAHMCNV